MNDSSSTNGTAPALRGGAAGSGTTRVRWLSFAATDAGLDALVLLYGLWTLCCHITMMCWGNGWVLFALFPLSLVLLAGLYVVYAARVRRAGAAPDRPEPRSLAPPESSSGTAPALRGGASDARYIHIVGLIGAGLVLRTWWLQHEGTWFWQASAGFMLVSAAYLLWRPLPPQSAADDQLPERVALFVLALIGGAIAASLTLANSDDVLYVNIGVSVADNPSLTLYATDTMHGGNSVPLAPYSVHSFELLAGFITRCTGLPTINVIHLVLGPLAGFLIAYAWARLLRLLEPSRWIWLVAIVIANYVLDGTSERSIVGHAFVRLFQGKAVLLTVHLPLLSAYAIEYVRQPSWRRWLLLLAAVIAGVGLSSTGLWLAPAVAGTALLVPLVWRWSYWKAAGLGLIACLYPVPLGLHIRSLLVGDAPISEVVADAPAETVGEYWPMIMNTFMHQRPTVVYIVCVVLAWPLARTALARRYLVAFSLVGVLVLFNPALNQFVRAYISGPTTHARVLWFVPFTLAFATCVAAPIEARFARKWRVLGALLSCLLLAQFRERVPTQDVFTLAPVTFPPELKVYRDGFDVALFLARVLPNQGSVLAPAGVSLALPMIQHHPYPLMTKPKFFAENSDGPLRFRLRRVIDGKYTSLATKQRVWFMHNMNKYKVTGIVMPSGVEPIPGMVEMLQSGGFKRIRTMGDLRIWTRPAPPSH